MLTSFSREIHWKILSVSWKWARCNADCLILLAKYPQFKTCRLVKAPCGPVDEVHIGASLRCICEISPPSSSATGKLATEENRSSTISYLEIIVLDVTWCCGKLRHEGQNVSLYLLQFSHKLWVRFYRRVIVTTDQYFLQLNSPQRILIGFHL